MSRDPRTRMVLEKFRRARRLLLARPEFTFFAELALHLRPVVAPCGVAMTDGVSLYLDPDRFSNISVLEAAAEVCHEILHCALGHPQAKREVGKLTPVQEKLLDVAMDFVVEQVVETHLVPRDDTVMSLFRKLGLPRRKDHLAYWRILRELPGPKKDAIVRKLILGQPHVLAAPNANAGAYWKQWVRDALVRHKRENRGTFPGALEEVLQLLEEPGLDPLDALRHFALRQVAGHSFRRDWLRPKRGYLVLGLWIPKPKANRFPVAVTLDTSGSMDTETLAECLTAIASICEAAEETIPIVQHDTIVQDVTFWHPGFPVPRRVRGRGGTSHVPVFSWIEENCPEVRGVIAFTDLASEFPPAPAFDVLWVTKNPRAEIPYGERLLLGAHES